MAFNSFRVAYPFRPPGYYRLRVLFDDVTEIKGIISFLWGEGKQ